jgi:hypothetical protein
MRESGAVVARTSRGSDLVEIRIYGFCDADNGVSWKVYCRARTASRVSRALV